jgi:uncharacterized protein with WD repeat
MSNTDHDRLNNLLFWLRNLKDSTTFSNNDREKLEEAYSLVGDVVGQYKHDDYLDKYLVWEGHANHKPNGGRKVQYGK